MPVRSGSLKELQPHTDPQVQRTSGPNEIRGKEYDIVPTNYLITDLKVGLTTETVNLPQVLLATLHCSRQPLSSHPCDHIPQRNPAEVLPKTKRTLTLKKEDLV